ncbi:MAG TPA: tripartite tricarboxylate transporter substrate binding protein [Burkholderiales bacterium]
MFRLAFQLAAFGTLCLGATAHAADPFPNHPIRMVVPFSAGGGTDVVARTVGQQMADMLGQSVVVDNRPGANGIIGAETVARAAPDGYTVLLTIASQSIAPAVYKKLPYDSLKDFIPVSLVATYPYVFVTPPNLPPKTFGEFVAYAKSKPGQLSYASSGNGSGPHLGMELIDGATGMRMIHVPYKGAANANSDLVSGQVQAMLNNFLAGIALIKSGRLRALAVTSAKRSSAMPELPTLAESGYPNLEVLGWYGMFVTAGTPPDVVAKLSNAAAKSAHSQAVLTRIGGDGAIPVGSTGPEFDHFFRAELTRWAGVAKKANVHLD